MTTVSDGGYRISLGGRGLITPMRGALVVFPGPADGQVWQILGTDSGRYLIRNGGLYMGWDDQPDAFEPIGFSSGPTEWAITDGPSPGTVTIGAPDSDLTLGLSPAAAFPPMVALSPPNRQDAGWTLMPA